MTMYRVVHGFDTEEVEAEGPMPAAIKFSSARKLRKGSVLRVLGKRGQKERVYKVGPNSRWVQPQLVITLPPLFVEADA